METKRCTKCQQTKPINDFGHRRQNPDGLQNECRLCVAQTKKEWRQNPEGVCTCKGCGKQKRNAEFAPMPSGYRSVKCRECRADFLARCRNQFTPNHFRLEGAAAYIELVDKKGVPVAEAIIDASDLSAVIAWGRWTARRTKNTIYAGSVATKRKAYLHRFIMQPPSPLVVDHLNGNGLDNRRENLRICDHTENMRNRKCHREAAQRKEAQQAFDGIN